MGTTPSATMWVGASIADSAEQLRRMWRWLTIAGVLSLLAGIVAIVLPNIASIATDVFVSGALALGLGLLIAMRLPEAASWAIGLVVGVDFIVTGALMIALARALRVRAR